MDVGLRSIRTQAKSAQLRSWVEVHLHIMNPPLESPLDIARKGIGGRARDCSNLGHSIDESTAAEVSS